MVDVLCVGRISLRTEDGRVGLLNTKDCIFLDYLEVGGRCRMCKQRAAHSRTQTESRLLRSPHSDKHFNFVFLKDLTGLHEKFCK